MAVVYLIRRAMAGAGAGSSFCTAGHMLANQRAELDNETRQLMMRLVELQSRSVQLQEESARNEAEEKRKAKLEEDLRYLTEGEIFKKLDPPIKDTFIRVKREWNTLTSNYEDYIRINEKNKQNDIDGLLHIKFEKEQKYQHPWLAIYEAVAQPQAVEFEHEDSPPAAEYDVRTVFKSMRERHAREANTFVQQHQAACSELLEQRCSHGGMLQSLKDELQSTFTILNFGPEALKAKTLHLAEQFVIQYRRTELANIRGRVHKDKEKQEKRKANLLKNDADWQEKPSQSVILSGILEAAKAEKDTKGRLKAKEDGALKFLAKDDPKLRKKLFADDKEKELDITTMHKEKTKNNLKATSEKHPRQQPDPGAKGKGKGKGKGGKGKGKGKSGEGDPNGNKKGGPKGKGKGATKGKSKGQQKGGKGSNGKGKNGSGSKGIHQTWKPKN